MSITLGAAALLGGGSLLGGILGGAANYATSAEAVKKQIAWERERAKNAHQWEVQDLQNAGLNPVLSAGGSGAVTGGISAPQPDMSPLANAIPNAIQAINTGKDIQVKDAQIANTDANTGLTTAMKATEEAKAISELNKADLISKQTAESASKTLLNQQQKAMLIQEMEIKQKKLESEIDMLKAQADQARAEGKYKEAASAETKAKAKLIKKQAQWYVMDKITGYSETASKELRNWINTGMDMVRLPGRILSLK